MSASRHPRFPHAQRGPSALMTVCPISPAKPVRAPVERAVDNDPASDPRSEGETDEISQPPPRSHRPFSVRGRVRVVLDDRGHTELALEDVPQRDVLPSAQVGRYMQEPALAVDEPRAIDSRGGDRPATGRHYPRATGAPARRPHRDPRPAASVSSPIPVSLPLPRRARA